MKKRCPFFIVVCMMFGALSGCCHKPVVTSASTVIAVQDDQTIPSAYADKGGTLKWEAVDNNPGGFQIVFPYGPSPCKRSDKLSTLGTEVVCHVETEGIFYYELHPYNGQEPKLKASSGGISNLAQVGNCKNCKGGGKGGGGRGGAHQLSTSDHLAYIGCISSNLPKGIQVPDPQPPFITKQKLEWEPLTPVPDLYGATFNSPSPCNEGTGPFYGTGNMCTLADNASGSYTYTVARKDCGNSTPSDPITITVQKSQ